VFIAEFLLKRAKCYAECGKDVMLVVDSLNALAHAFNETDASAGGKVLAGGLESKTLQYVKRYFGAARCLEKGGSLSIFASISKDTGNPMDDLIQAELSSIANLEIALSDELAKKRIYPPIDFINTQGKLSSLLLSGEEDVLDLYIRNEYIPKHGIEKLYALLQSAATFEEFSSMIKKD
jgi:transcription termination factor Rho